MELNITEFFRNAAPRDYSASVAEIGTDAGRATWQAAVDDSEDYPLLDTDEKREAFRVFVRESGGWTVDEIARWSDAELTALCIQWIAGDIRECSSFETPGTFDWDEYKENAEAGIIPSRLFRTDDGSVYFDMG